MRKLLLFLIVFGLMVVGSQSSLVAQQDVAGIHCNFEPPEWPHISKSNEIAGLGQTIKTSTTGTCDPLSPEFSFSVTARMYLEVQTLGGYWLDTAGVGVPIKKTLGTNTQTWFRGQLFALRAPCVPGIYRGRVITSGESGNGDIALGFGEDKVSQFVQIDCKDKQVSMVIDDTGSMTAELGSVKSALTSYINSQPTDDSTKWNLTTFKDSPTNVGSTQDQTQILGWVNALYASGGGDCPEDSLGGISAGLSSLGTDPSTSKQMLVATDASSHYGDVNSIIAQAQASGVKVNVLLAGDCSFPTTAAASLRAAAVSSAQFANGPDAQASKAFTLQANPDPLSSQIVLKRIANETGGQYFFIPNGTPDQYLNAINKIFASIAGQIIDVSARVHLTQTGFGRNRATGIWAADMTVTNTSSSTITAPLQVALTDLTPGVTMTNRTGLYGVAPYITVATGDIAPGASITVSIQFSNPTNGLIGFTPKAFSGTF